MNSVRHLLVALVAGMAVAAVAPSSAVFAGSTGNPNDPAYWESQLGDGASCVKHDPGDTTADGAITVLKAGAKTPELLAENPPLGERIAATPAIADNTLYIRTANHLYAFAEK